ncbi:pilus assembly protein TadG-related protein [Methylocaldum sp. MU1018]
MPFRTSLSPPGFRRQRGAIGLLAALVLLPAVLFTALALDTGRLFLEKRKLQKIADLSALDAAHAMACADDRKSEAVAAARASAARNGYAGDLAAEGGVKIGIVKTPEAQSKREFQEGAPGGADAVQVETRSTVPASLVAGGWFSDATVTLRAEAVGRSDAIAGISAGSFLARLDDGALNRLLGGLLGTNVNLDLVSYQGIADANLTLLDLIQAQGSVGTVDELLALQMSVGDFIELMATALTNKGDSAVAADLSGLMVGVPDTLTLGDLLKVTTDDPEAAATASVNALDLLVLGAEVANGQNAIAIPAAGITVPGVASIGLSLRLIEPPQIAIGPAGQDENGNWRTQVQTAQARLGINLGLVPMPLGIPLVLTIQLVNLQLAVDAAPTTAWLENVGCPAPDHPDGSATVGSQPGVITIAVGTLDANGEVTGPANVATVEVLGLLGGGVKVQIGASADVSVAGDLQSTPFDGPFPQTETVGTPLDEGLNSALSSLAGSLDLQVMVGSLNVTLLNQVINLLVPILTPIITGLGDAVLTPLLEALGVNVGGADLGVFTVRFARPTLVI